MEKGNHEAEHVEALIRALAERDAMIATLESALEHVRAALRAAPISYFVLDRDGTFVAHDGGAAAALGRSPGDRMGTPASAYFASVPGGEEALRAALSGESRSLVAVQASQTFSVTLVPVLDAERAVRTVAGIAINITAQEGAERALRISDARFRAMIEKSTDSMWLTDANGIVLYVSPGVRSLLGRSPADLLGRPFLDSVHPEDRLSLQRPEEDRRPLEERTDVFRMVDAEGGVRWVESIWSDHTTDPNLGGFVASLRDVTARRREQESMKQRQDVMDRAQAVAHVGDWECAVDLPGDPRAQRITWSAECARIFGGDFAAPPTLREFLAQVHPEDRDQVIATSDVMFARDEPSVSEHRIIRPDGAVRFMSAHAVLRRDERGRPRRVVGVLQDVTERRVAQDELIAAANHLRQAQKMEAIGNLAGGIAHDFNNLLSVIQSYAGVLLEELPGDAEIRHDAEQITRAAERAAELTRQLLAFSRKQVLAPRHVDLEELVPSMQRMLERMLGEHITFVWNGSSSSAGVFADPGQIEQVIMNLVVNARDAMPNGGKLFIETSSVAIDARQHPDMTPGRYVKLSVTDTGMGMEEHVRARVFEPFFTTKALDKGTGLGLATVFGIVKQSGGHIDVRSAPGEGTTFDVYLPRSDASGTPASGVAAPSRSLAGTETILVVEDQDALRTILCTVLERHGYRVFEAQNGVEALLVSERLAERIDLLLTDVVMPRMSGTELARRLCEARPELKVLYMSGFPRGGIEERQIGEHAYLQKPVTPLRVLARIRELLA